MKVRLLGGDTMPLGEAGSDLGLFLPTDMLDPPPQHRIALVLRRVVGVKLAVDPSPLLQRSVQREPANDARDQGKAMTALGVTVFLPGCVR